MAVREVLEETGGASYVGEASDPAESSTVQWLSVAQVRELPSRGKVVGGLSLIAVLWWFSVED